jgi:hypothetical protein
MNFMKRVWSEVRNGENLDYYLTIVVSIVVGIVGLFGMAKDQIAPLTLAVLALLAFAGLKSRYQSDELTKKLEKKIASEISLDEIFEYSAPVLRERLKKAKSISHNGISLVGTSNGLLDVFSTCLANGGDLRLLVANPDREKGSLKVIAQRFEKHQDVQKLTREVEHALDNFSLLTKSSPSNFQLRLFPAVPPYSVWMIDNGTPQAEIWVSIYSFRHKVEPALHLLPNKDKMLFDFFSSQFETMWQVSEKWYPQ